MSSPTDNDYSINIPIETETDVISGTYVTTPPDEEPTPSTSEPVWGDSPPIDPSITIDTIYD